MTARNIHKVYRCSIDNEKMMFGYNGVWELKANDYHTMFFMNLLNPMNVGKKMIEITKTSPQLIPKKQKKFKPVVIPKVAQIKQESPFQFDNKHFNQFTKLEIDSDSESVSESIEYQNFMKEFNLEDSDIEQLEMQAIETKTMDMLKKFIRKQVEQDKTLENKKNDEVDSL